MLFVLGTKDAEDYKKNDPSPIYGKPKRPAASSSSGWRKN
jgi:hypothetical protein